MKWNLILGSLVLALGLGSQASAGLLDGMFGGGGCKGHTQKNGCVQKNGHIQKNGDHCQKNGHTQKNGCVQKNGHTQKGATQKGCGCGSPIRGFNLFSIFSCTSCKGHVQKGCKGATQKHVQKNGCVQKNGHTQKNGCVQKNGHTQKNGCCKDHTQESHTQKGCGCKSGGGGFGLFNLFAPRCGGGKGHIQKGCGCKGGKGDKGYESEEIGSPEEADMSAPPEPPVVDPSAALPSARRILPAGGSSSVLR